MKLLNKELNDKLCGDVYNKVLEHEPWNSPVRNQIQKNLGWLWGDDTLIRSKIYNPKLNIIRNLNETD